MIGKNEKDIPLMLDRLIKKNKPPSDLKGGTWLERNECFEILKSKFIRKI